MKKLALYTAFLSALICTSSEYIAYKEIQKLDLGAHVEVGYPTIYNCSDEEDCVQACVEAYRMGIIENLNDCER